MTTDCIINGDFTINSYVDKNGTPADPSDDVLLRSVLIIDPGVTFEVTGDINIKGGSTIIASGSSSIIVGDSLKETLNSTGENLISGGNYTIAGSITEEKGGDFTLDNVTMIATNLTSIDGGSLITISNGSDITLTGDLNNTEDLTIDASYLEVGGDLNATGGDVITITNGGELVVTNDVNMNGGGITIDVNGASSVDIGGDVSSNDGGNEINIDDDSGVAVGGSFTGTDVSDVNVTGGGDPTACLTGGCCGNAATCSIILPVSLVSFDYQLAQDYVELKWTTATELNNDFFTIEKSYDGINFSHLKNVSGNGTTNEPITYSLIDPSHYSQHVYYRLSQTDFDGTHENLGTVLASASTLRTDASVYPNPLAVGDELNLLIPFEALEWSIITLTGQLVSSGGTNGETTIKLSDVRPGTYLLRIKSGEFQYNKRLIITE